MFAISSPTPEDGDFFIPATTAAFSILKEIRREINDDRQKSATLVCGK